MADLEVRRPRPEVEREALRDPVHRLVGRAVPARLLLAYLTLEKALEFLISWAGDDVEALFQVSKYVRLVTLMAFAFGVGFQFPVLLVFLQLVGVLTPQQLLGAWRYAIVGIVVLAAVITPSGDPISLAALAGPMLVLYFIAVGIGLLVQRRSAARERGRRGVVRRR